MKNNFFAFVSRMKYIDRWALMRNSYTENISEHSLEVSMLTHALCVIGNKRLGKSLDAEKAVMVAIYHDASEIITGDMPTPIKYLNKDIKGAFKEIEAKANRRLLDMLPDDMVESYEEIFFPGESLQYELKLVKAADKLSALIKCIEEEKTGNTEFKKAGETLLKSVEDMHLEEADIFMKDFLPAYHMTLDELNEG
ncbi:MAG: 5'-deoxynucleotidase [Lachnospiraceae bacterium]|jgi:5'-deoxynucleotidase|nr:5'-deoxynucleotidase [Lachnospiraceae bacterium]